MFTCSCSSNQNAILRVLGVHHGGGALNDVAVLRHVFPLRHRPGKETTPRSGLVSLVANGVERVRPNVSNNKQIAWSTRTVLGGIPWPAGRPELRQKMGEVHQSYSVYDLMPANLLSTLTKV